MRRASKKSKARKADPQGWDDKTLCELALAVLADHGDKRSRAGDHAPSRRDRPLHRCGYDAILELGRGGRGAGLADGARVQAMIDSPSHFKGLTDPEERKRAARELVAEERGVSFAAIKKAHERFRKTGRPAMFYLRGQVSPDGELTVDLSEADKVMNLEGANKPRA